jgi:hypothetical protein
MFYTFVQNNSGGNFFGPHYVIIEANSAEEANNIAESEASIYFHGCEDGRDCTCCGDRWHPVNAEDGTESPQIYGVLMEGTEDEIVAANNSVFAKYGYYDCDIYYSDMKKELRFDKEDYQKAKKKDRSKRAFKYGWRFYQDWKKPTKVYKAYVDDNDDGIFWAANGDDDLMVSEKSNWLIRDIGGGEMIYYAADTKKEAEESRKSFAEFLDEFNKQVLKMLKHQSHPAIKILANRYK